MSTNRDLNLAAAILDTLKAELEQMGLSDESATTLASDALGMTEQATYLIWKTMVDNSQGDVGMACTGCLILGARIARAQQDNLRLAA